MPDVPPVKIEANQPEPALTNLVVNACDGDAGGWFVVSAEMPSRYVDPAS